MQLDAGADDGVQRVGGALESACSGAHSACMRRRHESEAVQYTIRNVPKVVDRALRRRAQRLSKSLNEVAVEALARGADVRQQPAEHHDVDFLFGSWIEDEAVDRALAEQRKVDAGLWR